MSAEAKMIEYAASYRQVKNPYDNGDKDANAESRQVVGKLDDRAVSLNAVMDILNEIQADIEDGEGYDYHKWKSIVDELPSVTPKSEEELKEKIKTLGEEMRITQKGIADEKVLIGFNMAIALCNKHIGENRGR